MTWRDGFTRSCNPLKLGGGGGKRSGMAEASTCMECDNLLRCRFHSNKDSPPLPVRVVVYAPWELALRNADAGAKSR